MFDFQDGKGLVPAHKHPNGGGWVADSARVASTAYVGPDARVSGNAWVSGDAQVDGNARVFGNAKVYGNARVFGNAWVYGNACVHGYARVCGDAKVYGKAYVFGKAKVYVNARLYGNAQVFGNATKRPLVLNGFPHLVTITDSHVRVGCEFHLATVWAYRGAAIIKSDGHSSEKAKEWANIINMLARSHGCLDS